MSGTRPSPSAALLVPAFAVALCACSSTTDSLGYNGYDDLWPIKQRTTTNVFASWRSKTPAEIDAKINLTWNQLFYGDNTQKIYYIIDGTDQAEVRDTFHGDIRTEGFGYAMMIAVQLDKRTEFDRMWSYVKSVLSYPMTDPSGGYYQSVCDSLPPSPPVSCNDPFGHQQFATALLFARDRWGVAGKHNYAVDAAALLKVMRHKEDMNGGIVNDVTNTFDYATALPLDVPEAQAAGVSRPSLMMPAFYELWAEATRDPFWTRAAIAARDYWKRSAHPTTGLFPRRAYFDGTPVESWDMFESESFRAQISMVLDWEWFAREPWQIVESNRLLQLFSSKGMSYVGSYALDGAPLTPLREYALVATNGVSAMISTHVDKNAYVDAVWNMPIQTGPARYFSGLLQLTALLILSGQYTAW